MKKGFFFTGFTLFLLSLLGTSCASPIDGPSDFGSFYLQNGAKWSDKDKGSKKELGATYLGAYIEISEKSLSVWKRYDANDYLGFEWSDRKGCYVFQRDDQSEAQASIVRHDDASLDITFHTSIDPFFWTDIGESTQFECRFAREIPFSGAFGEYPVEDVRVSEAYYNLPARDSQGYSLRWEDWRSLVQVRYDEFFLRCDFKTDGSDSLLKKNYAYNPKVGAYQATESSLFYGNRQIQVRLSEGGFVVAACTNEGGPFEEYVKVAAHYGRELSDPDYYTRFGPTNPRDDSSYDGEELSDSAKLGSYRVSAATVVEAKVSLSKEIDNPSQLYFPTDESSYSLTYLEPREIKGISGAIHITDSRIYCLEISPSVSLSYWTPTYEYLFRSEGGRCFMPHPHATDASYGKLEVKGDGTLSLFVRFVHLATGNGEDAVICDAHYEWFETEFLLTR